MTYKPPSVFINTTSMSQTELQEFVVDEIRKRVNNHIAPLRAEAKRHGLVLEMSDWGRDRE